MRDIDKLSVLGDALPPGALPGSWRPPRQGSRVGGASNRNSNNRNRCIGGDGMIKFESMYHLSPTTVWHLQSAYLPPSRDEYVVATPLPAPALLPPPPLPPPRPRRPLSHLDPLSLLHDPVASLMSLSFSLT